MKKLRDSLLAILNFHIGPPLIHKLIGQNCSDYNCKGLPSLHIGVNSRPFLRISLASSRVNPSGTR